MKSEVLDLHGHFEEITSQVSSILYFELIVKFLLYLVINRLDDF